MIAVIADDFTGAAELAGIGSRYGYKTILSIGHINHGDAELVIVCTDSRSMSKKEARVITKKITREIISLKPSMVYKKIDSVLRGHVLDELIVQVKEMGLDKILIIAANPSLGRTIRDGQYFINDKLISETGFASDPEFAITNSSVLRMVKAGTADKAVKVLKHSDELPTGITIGEAETEQDIIDWTKKVDNSFVIAGAGDFFTQLISRDKAFQKEDSEMLSPHLYVSGTSFDKSMAFIKERTGFVSYLPVSVMHTGLVDNDYINEVTKKLREHKKLIIAIDADKRKGIGVSALGLRITMAVLVREVVERANIKELFIEGGSTAGAILQELDITEFIPIEELQRGVVRMKAMGRHIHITVKPGSYELPQSIKELYN